MALEQIAQAHYRRSALTTQRVVAAVLAIWRATGPSGFRDELPRAAGLVAAGQLAQAVQAAAYLIDLADEQGLAAADAVLNPRSLSGVAANGRALVDVLSYPVNRTWQLLDAGADFATAESSGLASLTRIAGNEIDQAGITAEQIGMIGQTQMTGYYRMANAPSCGRCAVLAGAWYRWNAGFKRHPGCDCVHVPVGDKDAALKDSPDLKANPREYFDSLSEREQNRLFGAAESDALRKGADVSRAINTRGSMTLARRERRLLDSTTGKARDAVIADLTRRGYLIAA